MKIKKGDKVIVITGKNKGESGVVVRALPKTNQIIIDGINVHKKHMKPTARGGKGSTIEKSFPINMSNVMIEDGKGKRSRVGSKVVGTKKVRVATKSGTEI